MNIEKIVDMFGRLSGLSTGDILKFRFICEAASEYITSHTKNDVDLSEYGDRLCFAASALAYYRYVLWSLTDGESMKIKVGEISTEPATTKKLEAAEKLWKNAFDGISDCLIDDDFFFERI